MLGNPLSQLPTFLLLTGLGGISLSLVFTFLAAIAARAQQSAALMAILGFPIIIPQLMLLNKISNAAFGTLQGGASGMISLLIGLDIMVITLAIILFPFLWKD
jgi:heme exporter protein B